MRYASQKHRYGGWDTELFDKVIARAGLLRVFGSHAEARQFLVTVILDYGLDRFRNSPSAVKWVVLYRRAVDEGRKLKVRQRYQSAILPVEDQSWSDRLTALGREPQLDPEQIVELRDLLRILQAGMDGLPRRSREILKQYYFDGLSHEVIAANHSISRQRVQQIIVLSLKELKKHF